MTTTAVAVPTVSIDLTAGDRHAILENVLAALTKRFYAPEKLNSEWQAAVDRHRPIIESAFSAEEFEQAVSSLLSELHTSHIGFFHTSARRASSRAALSATYIEDETAYGRRWIFQGVHSGGAAAIAGIEPGNILLAVDSHEIIPPEHPVFPMGQHTKVELIDNRDTRKTVTVDVAQPKGKKLHFIEPTLVESRKLGDETGYLKVAMFPGMVGVVVANRISDAISQLGNVERLIIDLRGNTGGGIGALRVMSLLTPDKIPVGFALDKRRANANIDQEKQSFPRFSRIPSKTSALWPLALRFAPAMLARRPVILETEGLGKQPFHNHVILLVDRHTASAAEMIVAFARENQLATIVGERTAGRLLSATSVKVGKGFRLALPTGRYYTWKGTTMEGAPIEPDEFIGFDWQARRRGEDKGLTAATKLRNWRLSA